MITFKGELPMDHEVSLTPWADRWTKEIQEENGNE